jgi:hypothetical protein
MRSLLLVVVSVAAAAAAAACAADTFATGDGGTDSGASDAQPGGDTGAGDAGSDVATCTQNDQFCSGRPATNGFCDSFDNENAGTSVANWTTSVNSGEVRVDVKAFHTCPHALSATLPAEKSVGVPDGGWHAVATRPVNATGPVALSLQVFLPPANTSTMVVIAVGATDQGNGLPFSFGLDHHADGNWYLESQTALPGLSMSVELTPPPATQTWVPMTLHIPYGETQTVVLDYVDAQNNTQHATSADALVVPPVSGVGVALGLAAPGATEASFTAYFDDVELTSQ